MSRAGTVIGAVVAVLATFMIAASGGHAATIGSTLNVAPATNEGCEVVVLPPLRQTLPVPGSCTFYAANAQTPRGSHVITEARVRTGPRVGPMRFTVVRAMRSQAAVNGVPAGIICCTSPAESQVFVPQPNTINTIPVRIPVQNVVTDVDGEPVEVVDYLGISLLDRNSGAPLGQAAGPFTSYFAPALQAGTERFGHIATLGFAALPLINAETRPCAGTGSASASSIRGCPGFRPGAGGGPGGDGGGPGGSPGPGAGPAFFVARRSPLAAAGTAARVITRVPTSGAVRVAPMARFRRILRPATARVGRGINRLTVRLTRPGRRALAKRGAFRVGVVIAYRGAGGDVRRKRHAIQFRRGG